jgi:SAM-dependent methyltransferase
MTECDPEDTRAGYDRVAAEYARRVYHELRDKPLDRELLDRFASELRGAGPVCDVGCGPGQIARYLYDRGVDAGGLDLSPAMVAKARELNPGLTFRTGDLRALPFGDGELAGIAAFYSIIHIPRVQVVAALRELARVLRPGGRLLLAFHVGDEVRRVDELWGEPLRLDFVFFEVEEVRGHLVAAGFEVADVVERGPYPDVEVQTHRAYMFARTKQAAR